MTETDTTSATEKRWYVLRDLKRPNAKMRAWQTLEKEEKMKVFTPKICVPVTEKGKHKLKEKAFIPDLLFVYDSKEAIDPIVSCTETLQYRFRKYGTQNEPLVVPDADMERFIKAVETTVNPKYYTIDEVTNEMRNRRIRIIGGPLNNYEGYLITTRGSKKKRLLMELQDLFAASIEVNPEFIQLV